MHLFTLIATVLFAVVLAACAATPPTNSAAPARKPTILIVHGAWGGAWTFRTTAECLAAKGYRVFRPTLTGLGERSHLANPDINLSTHIQDIVNVILFEDLHDVILVGHSYGGMVITGVADRLPDRIKKRIYVDAMLPEDGESVDSLMSDPVGRSDPEGYIYPSWAVPADPPHDVPMPARAFSERISLRHAVSPAAVSALYILTVEAGQTPPQDRFYRFYVRAQGYHWATHIMTAGHNPQKTQPEELAELLAANAQ